VNIVTDLCTIDNYGISSYKIVSFGNRQLVYITDLSALSCPITMWRATSKHHLDEGLVWYTPLIWIGNQSAVQGWPCGQYHEVLMSSIAVNFMKRVDNSISWTGANEKLLWPKVTSLVFIFWSLSWTNWLNTQPNWKHRYRLIQCAYLKPSATHFSDRRRNSIGLKIGINTELLMLALISRLTRWCLVNPLAGVY